MPNHKVPQSPALAKWHAEHPEKRAEFGARRRTRRAATPFPSEDTKSEQMLWLYNEYVRCRDESLRKYERSKNIEEQVKLLKLAHALTLKIKAWSNHPDAEEQYRAFMADQLSEREKRSPAIPDRDNGSVPVQTDGVSISSAPRGAAGQGRTHETEQHSTEGPKGAAPSREALS
jgi:hypothetical protein